MKTLSGLSNYKQNINMSSEENNDDDDDDNRKNRKRLPNIRKEWDDEGKHRQINPSHIYPKTSHSYPSLYRKKKVNK